MNFIPYFGDFVLMKKIILCFFFLLIVGCQNKYDDCFYVRVFSASFPIPSYYSISSYNENTLTFAIENYKKSYPFTNSIYVSMHKIENCGMYCLVMKKVNKYDCDVINEKFTIPGTEVIEIDCGANGSPGFFISDSEAYVFFSFTRDDPYSSKKKDKILTVIKNNLKQ